MVLTSQQVQGLLEEARRNEAIAERLDEVDIFLLQHHRLEELLAGLGPLLQNLFDLEAVALRLCRAHPVVRELDGLPKWLEGGEPPCWSFCLPEEMEAWLGPAGGCLLSDSPAPEMLSTLFGRENAASSLAVVPLAARREMLGALALGADSRQAFHPAQGTHFLNRLGRKLAAGLASACLEERVMEMARREAVVEMAGSACHELAQPLTNLTLLLEIELRERGGKGEGGLPEMRREVERLSGLVDKISRVEDYATKPYAGDMRIVDLEEACRRRAGENEAK